MTRRGWHLRAGSVVLAWLVALLVVTLVHRSVPAARWLMVHLLLLGAVSNAILIWSTHFTAALLRSPEPASRRPEVARLVLLNVGAVAVVAGVLATAWPAVLLGAVGVVAAIGWHVVTLLLGLRRSLPARFASTVRYYVAAGLLLPVGVSLGVLMARGGLAADLPERLAVAHAVVNLLGWVGLTVLGTLVTLWPTMLRTRIADDAERASRRALPLLVAGVLVAATGSVLGAGPVVAAGAVAYLVGLVVWGRPFLVETRARPPRGYATPSVLGGLVWLAGTVLTLAVVALTAGDAGAFAATAASLTAPMLAGVVVPVLLGALSYLVPVVLGGGPTAVRAATAVIDKGAPLRIAAANGALLVCVLPVPSLVRVLCSVIVLGVYVSTVVLLLQAVRGSRRRDAAAAPAEPAPPAAAGVSGSRALAGAGVAMVVLAVALAVAVDPPALGIGTVSAAGDVTPTGRTTTVEVVAEGMRFHPGTVEVPAGDRLVVVLTNKGDQSHDLVLSSGARTPRIAPGEQTTLDAGVVGRSLDGWCSVAGHRQMGMVLSVLVVGGTPATDGADGGHAAAPGHGTGSGDDPAAPSAADDLDLEADPGPGFVAYDPVLAPAPAERVHRVRLEVTETVREVAPGVTQQRWSYGGSSPGPTLRGKVGDVFEVTLVNRGTSGHSVDFHAGALAPDRPMRTIEPGEELTYRFTATRSGAWLYHCSTMPMSLHIANGMFGAVIIDPPDLAPVDREYVLVQSELYLGAQGESADPARIAAGVPDLVAFNGYARQYDHVPMTARTGERVRFWVVDAGPDRASAFHVVGGQFDTVYSEGAYSLRAGETTGGAQVLPLVPAQGGFVELTFPQPGHYPVVTHVMSDAERGAYGTVVVTD